MTISGKFQNSKGINWFVYFRSDRNPGVDLTINESDSTIFFAPDAVTINHNYESTFQHVIKRSAQVNILTQNNLSDYLFGYKARDIQVLIFRELELVFAGFVEPGTYNQPYIEPHDVLNINCIDVLSTFEYYNYKDLYKPENYDAYKQGADNVTPKQIFDFMFRTNLGTLDFVNNIQSKVYWDQSKSLLDGSDILDNMQISELLFLDEDFDSLWTTEQVLNEVLQYLNLHIIQLGRDFFIYDNEYMRRIDSESKPFKEIFSGNTLTKQIVTSQLNPYTLQKSHYNSDDTNISVDDVYNKIEIKCDLIDSEDVIESPFDDDALTSPFPMRQIYCTEAIAQGEGTRAKKAFWTFVKNGRYLVNQDDYDGVSVNDYYLQYMTNPNWVFYDGYNNNIDTYLEQDSDGNYYKQWKVPSVYPWVTGAMPSEHGLVTSILSFGVHSVSGQAIAEDDAARMPNKLDQANYIVMSINGNQKHDSTHTPTDSQLQQASPAAVYTGAVSGGVYSPPDDETTNYIVFSGTIMYQPVETTKKSYSWTEVMNMDSWGNITSSHTVKYLDGEEDDDKKAYRAIKWYNTDYPTSIDDTTHYTTVDMLDPCFSNSIQKSRFFGYNYSYISGYHVAIDVIKNLSVLECELIIGDKCLAEDYDEDGKSIYEWVNKTTGNAHGRKTFSLGINPKLGDFIIGQEYKISNNITFKMNLDNAEGTAIPIKKSDNLSGKVEFKILGPVNQVWNDITRRHSTWFRSEKFYDNDKYVLAEVKNIVIKDFEAKFYSDNGGFTYNDGQDLIYMSVENDQYINKKSDIEFKINTALTSDECKEKGIKQGIRISNPVYNGEAITKIASKVISDTSILEAKPEELYIDQYYREYSKARLITEVSVSFDYMKDLNEIDVYGSITKLNSLDKAFSIVGMSYESETDSRKLILKEIGNAASGSDSGSGSGTTTLTYTIYANGNPLTVADPTSLTYTWTEETDSTWYAVYTVEVDSEYADDYEPVMGFIDKMVLDWQPIMTTITIPIVYATDDPNNPSGSGNIDYSTTLTDTMRYYTEDVVIEIPKYQVDDYVFNPDDFIPTDYEWTEMENFIIPQGWGDFEPYNSSVMGDIGFRSARIDFYYDTWDASVDQVWDNIEYDYDFTPYEYEYGSGDEGYHEYWTQVNNDINNPRGLHLGTTHMDASLYTGILSGNNDYLHGVWLYPEGSQETYSPNNGNDRNTYKLLKLPPNLDFSVYDTSRIESETTIQHEYEDFGETYTQTVPETLKYCFAYYIITIETYNMTDSSLDYWSIRSEKETNAGKDYEGSVKLRDLFVNYDSSGNTENSKEHTIFDSALETQSYPRPYSPRGASKIKVLRWIKPQFGSNVNKKTLPKTVDSSLRGIYTNTNFITPFSLVGEWKWSTTHISY